MRAFSRLLALSLALLAFQVRADESPLESPVSLWFPVGEELVSKAYWGVFNVAESRTTTSWTNHEGRTLLVIRIRTKSNNVISKIYPVDDTIETLIEPTEFLPVRFSKILNEGRYHTDEETIFDHAAGIARWHNRRKDTRKEFAIEPDTRDLVSLMYFLRRDPFVPGQKLAFKVMADEKIYDLFVNVAERETVELERYGKVKAIRIEPDAAFDGIFVRKGKLTIWVSDDPRCLMVRVMAVVPVANVRINVDKVMGPGDDFWIKKGK